jgi:general secretion pathway protein D
MTFSSSPIRILNRLTFLVFIAGFCCFGLLVTPAMAASSGASEKVTILADAIRLRDQGRFADALALLDSYLNQYPNDPHIHALHRSIRLSGGDLSMEPSNAGDPDALIAEVIAQRTGAGKNGKQTSVVTHTQEHALSFPMSVLATPAEEDSGVVEMLQRKGKAQFLGGDYEGALETYRELEKHQPDNPEAKEYQMRILEIYNRSAPLNRMKTREEMLNEVHRSWQRPRIFSPDSNRLDGESGQSPLLRKIREIRIPRVSFSNLELTAVIETLSELSVEYDTDPDLAQRGVNIVPLFDPNTRDNPKVSINLRNLTLEKILQFVTQQVNFQFDLVEEAILVQPADGPDGTANLLTEFFPVSRATVIRISGGRETASASLFSDNPFEAAVTNAPSSLVGAEEEAIKGFFQRAGVEFAGIRGASLAFDGTQLIATQTSRNLERMRNILRRYEKTRQVEIEAKFLEVQQQDLDELGLDWLVRSGRHAMFDDTGMPLMDSTGRQKFQYDTSGSSGDANRSLAEAFSLNQFSQGVHITSPKVAGGQLFAPLQAPIIPQTLNFAEDVMGGILNTVSILGSTEVGVVVRALSRKEGSDLMSAPRLTVLSGKTASITVAQELRYPESYGDIKAEVSRGVASTATEAGGGGAVAITAGTPQDFVVRNVGVEMEVTPTVEDNDNISLLLEPKVTEFEGFVEYGGPSIAISGDMTATIPSGFYQPIFSTRRVKTEVTIYDGATVVIGGLTREEIKAVDDKVPLLGDIPYLGRLFRTKGETTRKRNLLIFVTANLIGPGGSPIKQEFPMMEPNALFQNPSIVTPGGGVNRAIHDESKKP